MNDRTSATDNFDNLRTLLAATTPGEWEVMASESADSWPTVTEVETGNWIVADWGAWLGQEQMHALAAFIVAAHNELPALLARLDEVTAEKDALAAVVSSAVGVVESYKNWHEDWPEDSWRFERDIRDALNLTDKEES